MIIFILLIIAFFNLDNFPRLFPHLKSETLVVLMIDDQSYDNYYNARDHHDHFHTWSVRLSRSCLSTGTIKETSAPVQWESYNHDDHDKDDHDDDGGGDHDDNDDHD